MSGSERSAPSPVSSNSRDSGNMIIIVKTWLANMHLTDILDKNASKQGFVYNLNKMVHFQVSSKWDILCSVLINFNLLKYITKNIRIVVTHRNSLIITLSEPVNISKILHIFFNDLKPKICDEEKHIHKNIFKYIYWRDLLSLLRWTTVFN